MAKRTEKKKVKKVDAQTDLIQRMEAKLNSLESQLQERDTKLNALDKTQQELGKGTQRYGASTWKKWESGSEKGQHRSFYVDIKSMVTPRAI